MNRKFKHKKLGWIAEQQEKNWCSVDKKSISLPIEIIEGSSDWEEILEGSSNWKVHSFVCVRNNKKYFEDKNKKGFWRREDFVENATDVKEYDKRYFAVERALGYVPKTELLPYAFFIKNEYFSIHSVKRLSDGAVFSTGDFVSWGLEKKDGFRTSIKSFFIDKGNLVSSFSTKGFDKMKVGIDLPNFHKIENIAIIDHTGQPILEDEGYWYIDSDFETIKQGKANTKEGFSSDNIRFRVKEDAIEYFVTNKQFFSISKLQELCLIDSNEKTITVRISDLKDCIKYKEKTFVNKTI